MTTLVFNGGNNESLLIDLCVSQENPKTRAANVRGKE